MPARYSGGLDDDVFSIYRYVSKTIDKEHIMGASHAAGWHRHFDPRTLGLFFMGGHRGRHHHHHRGRGGPGFPFGGFGWGGPGFPFQRGSRARRGDVRAALLALLAEEPRNGYQLMQEIERRSDGVWRPSPGSVYPALQQLEDEGLVRVEETEGRRLYHLTDSGRTAAAEAGEPWEAASDAVDSDVWELFGEARQVGMAIFQLAQAGSADQLAAARDVLANARRALYGILAEDTPGDA
jgi:DNA-binding PadR family transcriptional regulator